MPASPEGARPEAWRLFVGVPLSEPLRSALRRDVERWRASPGAPNLRWTDPDGWHVTLAFLGDVDPADVSRLAEALQTVGAVPAFGVPSDRVGAFPRPSSARVVWYGFADPEGRFADLAAVVQRAVQPGAEPGSFRAHVTLGRSRNQRGEFIGRWIEQRNAPAANLEVAAVTLFRSHRGSGPSRYEALATVPLRKARSGRG